MIPIINIEDKIGEIDGPWSPIEVARVNDQVLRVSLFLGEYHWHKHVKEDELFYVYKGRIVIQVKEHPDITLNAGQIAVIPRNTEHRPKSAEPSYVVMFEPYALESKGSYAGPIPD